MDGRIRIPIEYGGPVKYSCLKTESYEFEDCCLTTIRRDDVLSIKTWRNEQIAVLRQNRILTDEDQEAYYKNVIVPSFHLDRPPIILFSYLSGGVCIGYGGLTNIDWPSRKAEISFLLDSNLAADLILYKKHFSVFLKLLKVIAFTDLKLNRLFTETYDIRPYHIETLEESGFVLEGRLREHVYINGNYVDSLFHGYLKEQLNV